VPVITGIITHRSNAFIAKHCCSECNTPLFDTEIIPGTQLIATKNIHSHDKSYTVPKGRLLRVSAFSDLPSDDVGFLFSGLLGAGPFAAIGFSTKWDINKIFSQEA